MMRAALILAGFAALLASCGGGGSGNRQNSQGIRMANPAHDDLMALSAGNQRLAMYRAIRDNARATRDPNLRCQTVVNAGYQEEYENMRMWVADCGGGAEPSRYAIYIAPNRDVQVRNCADSGRLSLPRCEPLPPAQPDDTMPKIQEGAADNAFKNAQ